MGQVSTTTSTFDYESWRNTCLQTSNCHGATNPETINNYFDQLEEILVSNSLGSCPSRIYDIDESRFPLQHRPGKKIAVRGQKHVTVPVCNDKTQVTVMACVSAAGSSIPPMVVFKRGNLTEDLIQGEVPDILYGLSK